mmetsp:Transcript_7386/g.18541  ORF Transcript_7386/g.18541 Transcript_7386/m.18541 type:complete len:127 (+) Transcript_7386:902-1282(+)
MGNPRTYWDILEKLSSHSTPGRGLRLITRRDSSSSHCSEFFWSPVFSSSNGVENNEGKSNDEKPNVCCLSKILDALFDGCAVARILVVVIAVDTALNDITCWVKDEQRRSRHRVQSLRISFLGGIA